jgi:hypothetical protein
VAADPVRLDEIEQFARADSDEFGQGALSLYERLEFKAVGKETRASRTFDILMREF